MQAVAVAKQLEAVPEELRQRHFVRSEGADVCRSDFRQNVSFGRHDLVRDPPISRVDLLVTRDTLMYVTPETEGRILGHFHVALRDDGYLFLGKSEVLLTRSNLFMPLALRHRIFANVPSGTREPLVASPPGRAQPAHRDGPIHEAGFDDIPVARLVIDRGGNLAANAYARGLFALSLHDVGVPRRRATTVSTYRSPRWPPPVPRSAPASRTSTSRAQRSSRRRRSRRARSWRRPSRSSVRRPRSSSRRMRSCSRRTRSSSR
jgi:hypothetical protein